MTSPPPAALSGPAAEAVPEAVPEAMAPPRDAEPGATTPPAPDDGPSVPLRLLRWVAGHPLAVDAVLAAAVLVVIVLSSVTVAHYPNHGTGLGYRELPPHTAVLAVLAAGALVFRRRRPVLVLTVTTLGVVADLLAGAALLEPAERGPAVYAAAVVALFTVANHTGRSTTWRLGLLVTTVVTAMTMVFGPQPWHVAENVGVFAWFALAAAAGEAVRGRRAMVDAIRERAERAEETREEEARRRVAEERLRIARELHDVVAHHIAMVNVQAGVASHVMHSRPDQAKEALAHVRDAGRQALEELQTTVGLLRQRDDPVAPTEPTSGLARLDDLVEGFGRAGMSVTVEAPAAGEPLPAAVDLAAYRVVQEALTNVHKHAGPSPSASVRLVRTGGRTSGALEITVHDDGAAPSGAAVSGGGHGLTGMRERAEALGGAFAAGPAPDGGFLVRVSLPVCRTGRPSAGGPGTSRGGAAGPARRPRGICL
ncbi:sensor histidine kinase [Streptomyces sp. SM12]|uniref:sensor histidine kinase n=1 Tax=Streptomyces sp. SM12 TaxID=1071602 RepID=UPI0021560412|nr:sensor histidine kinase [Streptomyces sp. SM12]